MALIAISQYQSKPTKYTQQLCNNLLDYCTIYPNTGLRNHKSDMILHIDSDVSFLIARETKCRGAGYSQLSSNASCPTFPNSQNFVE